MDIGIAWPQVGVQASPASIMRIALESERLDYASGKAAFISFL
ncbi:MAG TPA: hypothetical protein VL485_25160 [Ktedonobacteraceae bacterium]|jgi:hypothetical protein|nr:hypothetical protein [Ktedonobacteraceae bacterium]